MKLQWKKLILCIAVPLGAGGLSALLTRDGMGTFRAIDKPPLAPPGWLFPVVWSALYVLMGTASYLVLTSGGEYRPALTVYGLQLAVNFFWSLFFFNLGWYLFSFVWLILLLVLIILTMVKFSRLSGPAALLLLPYLLWVAFAGYLNLGVYLLNR